jgi:hypothetical protein
MKTRGRIKPSKAASAAQMLGGGLFALIGLIVIIPSMKEAGGPVWFGVIWTLLAASGTLMAAFNLFSEEGIATEEFSYTSEQQTPKPPARTTPAPQRSIQTRLKDLEALKAQGLVNESEYTSKRAELLQQI